MTVGERNGATMTELPPERESHPLLEDLTASRHLRRLERRAREEFAGVLEVQRYPCLGICAQLVADGLSASRWPTEVAVFRNDGPFGVELRGASEDFLERWAEVEDCAGYTDPAPVREAVDLVTEAYDLAEAHPELCEVRR